MQTSTQAVRARTDEPFLERFIEAHEAFVLRCASKHAGFAVTRSDDEYSVALLAFYEAIKGYDPASGPFGAYASLVIGRRLADHYRSAHRFDAEVKEKADALYDELQKRGVEVIYDDRAVSAGVMFSDADLLGIPLRVIVSPRNLKDGVIEISARDKSFSEKLAPAEVADRIQQKIAEMMAFDVE